ncbi:MAG: hypothetical protein VKK04_08895 [Synechococcales bacterium]|nr:hypothetical protein [Synechococcales bacterium]
MLLFFLPASLTLAIALHAFLTDETTPNTHVLSWVTVGVAAILWPITLPTMLRKISSRTSVSNVYPATTFTKLG